MFTNYISSLVHIEKKLSMCCASKEDLTEKSKALAPYPTSTVRKMAMCRHEQLSIFISLVMNQMSFPSCDRFANGFISCWRLPQILTTCNGLAIYILYRCSFYCVER